MLGAEAAGAGAEAAGAAELQGMRMCHASASRTPHDIKAGEFVRMNPELTMLLAGWLQVQLLQSWVPVPIHTLYVALDQLSLRSKKHESHTAERSTYRTCSSRGSRRFRCLGHLWLHVGSHISTLCCAYHAAHFILVHTCEYLGDHNNHEAILRHLVFLQCCIIFQDLGSSHVTTCFLLVAD